MHDSLGHNTHKKMLKKSFLFFTFTVPFFLLFPRKEGRQKDRRENVPLLTLVPLLSFVAQAKGISLTVLHLLQKLTDRWIFHGSHAHATGPFLLPLRKCWLSW